MKAIPQIRPVHPHRVDVVLELNNETSVDWKEPNAMHDEMVAHLNGILPESDLR